MTSPSAPIILARLRISERNGKRILSGRLGDVRVVIQRDGEDASGGTTWSLSIEPTPPRKPARGPGARRSSWGTPQSRARALLAERGASAPLDDDIPDLAREPAVLT